MPALQPDDLSARATIREAAADLFAEHGFAAVTVRQIAARAGVSPALVVHHFGSKAGLQAAVFERVQEWFDRLLAIGEDGELLKAFAARTFADFLIEGADAIGSEGTLARLFSRMILDREPAATELISRLAERSEQLLEPYVEQGLVAPDPDPRVRMAVLLSLDLGAMLLRPQLSEYLGFDPLSSEGIERWSAAVMRMMAATLTLPAPEPQEDTHAPH